MSDSSQQSNGATVIAEYPDVYLDWSVGNAIQGTITVPLLPKRLLPLPVRKKKILNIRRQLAKGTYDLDERLSIALDRFLGNLVG